MHSIEISKGKEYEIFLDGMDTVVIVILRARERKRSPYLFWTRNKNSTRHTQPWQEKAKDHAQN